MTKDEKQYASDRVEDLVSQARAYYKQKFTVEHEKMEPRDMLDYVVNQRPEVEVSRYSGTLKVKLKEESWPDDVSRVRGEQTDGFEKAMTPIREKAQEIKDDIYLGDSEAALNAIQELSEIVP